MRDGLTAVRKAKINEIFTKIEYLLRFIKKKMVGHEIHGRIHERLIKVVENLLAASEFPVGNVMWRVFKDPEEYEDKLQGHNYLFGSEVLESLLDERNAKRPCNDEDVEQV
jgi:hypothetical protein